jgi:hypothetical protein
MRSNVWLANRQRNARTNNISSGSTAKCNQCRVFTRRCAPRRTHISAMQEQHRTQTATTTLSLSCVRKHTLPFNLCVCSTRMHSQAHSLQSKRGCCQQAANPVFYNQEEKAHQTTPPAVTEPRPPSTPNPTMQRDEMRCMLTAASHKHPQHGLGQSNVCGAWMEPAGPSSMACCVQQQGSVITSQQSTVSTKCSSVAGSLSDKITDKIRMKSYSLAGPRPIKTAKSMRTEAA